MEATEFVGISGLPETQSHRSFPYSSHVSAFNFLTKDDIMHGKRCSPNVDVSPHQELHQASLWRPLLQLPIKVGHLVSLDFLLSCDIAREDANLLLETGVGFFVVASNDVGVRVLIARLPSYWTIYTRMSNGRAVHWLTKLPDGAHTFCGLMRLGLPPNVSQFVSSVEIIVTGEHGHRLTVSPLDKTVLWIDSASKSPLALRSALSGHAILQSNATLGKRVWCQLRLLYARLVRADDKLLEELTTFDTAWHSTICCYLLLSTRSLGKRRLQALRDEPLVAAAAFSMFSNRDNLGLEILRSIDRGDPVRRLVQTYIGCTRDGLRYINKTVGNQFTTLSALEFDCLLTAAALQPIARPDSVTELKLVTTDLCRIRHIENLLRGVCQLLVVNGADPYAMPSQDQLIKRCRVKCGRSIARKLKALRSGDTEIRSSSVELLDWTWRNAGAGIRRIAMYSRSDVETPVGLDLWKLSYLSLEKWTELASEMARSWSGKLTSLGVYATSERQQASRIWEAYGIGHLDGQPHLPAAIFADLPHGVHARQVLGPLTRQVGLELNNCLFNQASYFDHKLRQGYGLLVQFKDNQASVAELQVRQHGHQVQIKQHSGYKSEPAPINHLTAAQVVAERVQAFCMNNSAMTRAMVTIQEVMNDVTDESQGNFFRLAELMHVGRKFRVLKSPGVRIAQLEGEFEAYLEKSEGANYSTPSSSAPSIDLSSAIAALGKINPLEARK